MTTLSPTTIEGFLAVDPDPIAPREDGTARTRLVIGLKKQEQKGKNADGTPILEEVDAGWLTAFCQGKLAEQAAQRLKKGLLVSVTGPVTVDVYDGKPSLTMNVRHLGLSLFWNNIPTIEPGTRASTPPVIEPVDEKTPKPASTPASTFSPNSAPAEDASTPSKPEAFSSDNPFA